jgi:photosystem II stability/assembly factor-like uncharacterized protein
MPQLSIILLLLILLSCSPTVKDTSKEKITLLDTDKRHLIYQSNDLGLHWEVFATDLPYNTPSFIIQPFGKKMLLSTENDGLFISNQSKTEWEKIGQLIPKTKVNALDVKDGQILISLFRKGVYISNNEGQLWQSLNEGLEDLNTMCVLLLENELLTGTDSGLFKFNTKQRTWTKVFEGQQVVSLQQADNKIIAGTTAGILLSTDEGNSWEWIHQKGALHNTAILNGRIFGMYISNDIYVSDDWGATWTLGQYDPKIGSYIYDVTYVEPYYLMTNNHGVHRSADHGKTWDFIYPNKEFLFFDFAIDEGIIFASTRDF